MSSPTSYPTLEQVENAGWEQLAAWYRFLPSPGTSAFDCEPHEFQKRLEEERRIMNLVIERFHGFGGMTPEISKRIGWGHG